MTLTASDPLHLVAVCLEGEYSTAHPLVRVYASSDGGATFRASPTVLPSTSFGTISSPAPGIAVLGVGAGDLMASFDGLTTWSTVYTESSGTGWRYIGFTTSQQGVAIDGEGVLLMTFDGGRTWTPVNLP
jgi:photosystem II stability/assembly factor-like uncharacterized protein